MNERPAAREPGRPKRVLLHPLGLLSRSAGFKERAACRDRCEKAEANREWVGVNIPVLVQAVRHVHTFGVAHASASVRLMAGDYAISQRPQDATELGP